MCYIVCSGSAFSRELDVQLASVSKGSSAVERSCGGVDSYQEVCWWCCGIFQMFSFCAASYIPVLHISILQNQLRYMKERRTLRPFHELEVTPYPPPNIMCNYLALP